MEKDIKEHTTKIEAEKCRLSEKFLKFTPEQEKILNYQLSEEFLKLDDEYIKNLARKLVKHPKLKEYALAWAKDTSDVNKKLKMAKFISKEFYKDTDYKTLYIIALDGSDAACYDYNPNGNSAIHLYKEMYLSRKSTIVNASSPIELIKMLSHEQNGHDRQAHRFICDERPKDDVEVLARQTTGEHIYVSYEPFLKFLEAMAEEKREMGIKDLSKDEEYQRAEAIYKKIKDIYRKQPAEVHAVLAGNKMEEYVLHFAKDIKISDNKTLADILQTPPKTRQRPKEKPPKSVFHVIGDKKKAGELLRKFFDVKKIEANIAKMEREEAFACKGSKKWRSWVVKEYNKMNEAEQTISGK